MRRQFALAFVLAVFAAALLPPATAHAQTAQSVLQAAAKTMGTNTLKCVTYTGSGYVGLVGQNHDIREDWPRVELAGYTRTLNFDAKAGMEERLIRQGNYPTRGGGGIPNGVCVCMVVGVVLWRVMRAA